MIKIYENLDIHDLDGETWKVIENFSDYQISNFGRVKRSIKDKCNRKLKILKQYFDRCGYLRVSLYKNKKYYRFFVHRLVIINFRYNSEKTTNHINGIKVDNYINNLEYCTIEENNQHALDNNLNNQIGENNQNSILIIQDVFQIKLLLKNKKLKQQRISEIFEVSKYTISDIKRGKLWKHVKI